MTETNITMEDLKRMVFEGDPIAVVERPFTVVGNTMFLPGIDTEGEYAVDLEIDLLHDPTRFDLRYCLPGGETTWSDAGQFSNYDDLVSFIYTL